MASNSSVKICRMSRPSMRRSRISKRSSAPRPSVKGRCEFTPARTFVYYEDVEPLMEKNLIKGGSLENAIVVRGEAVLSKEPLRFPDEFVRHKIIDIIGDLALVGRRIRGHVVAVKPGHAANAELARALAREQTRRSAMSTPRAIPIGASGLDTREERNLRPQRHPLIQ